jgi:hypothetical protein
MITAAARMMPIRRIPHQPSDRRADIACEGRDQCLPYPE